MLFKARTFVLVLLKGSRNAFLHCHKLVSHIGGDARAPHTQSAMGEPRPGKSSLIHGRDVSPNMEV